MNENKILEDFLKLKEEGYINQEFSTFKELLDVLSNMFVEEYDNSSDAQEAFDDLNSHLKGMLNNHCAVYTLGTKEWDIEWYSNATDELINDTIEKFNIYYGTKLKDIREVCDEIIHRVMKDMSNCGCDVYNALNMVCDDVFGENNLFFVELGEEIPRISFLD